MDLTDKSTLISLLQKYHLYTNKNLGQHFLVDHHILDLIVETANLQPADTILEIGTGAGVLTRELAAKANKVITFEIDTILAGLLSETLADFDNINLHFEDFRQVLTPSSRHAVIPSNFKLVANLPYQSATHILSQLLTSPSPPESITTLIQREVAQKITAKPPHATYLSNFVQLYGDTQIIKLIPPGAFFPPPAVHSAMLHIAKHVYPDQTGVLSSPLSVLSNNQSNNRMQESINLAQPDTAHLGLQPKELTTENYKAFSRFLHRGFAQPRKMLNKAFPAAQLHAANIDPQLRPENLTLDEWLNLYQIVRTEE